MELPEKNGKHHYITCETQFYQAHEQGIKTFEACANDHNYKVGDIVHLQEVVNGVKTGRELDGKMITYIQYGGQYGIHEDCCVFQLDRESYIKR